MQNYKDFFLKHCLPILITSLLSAGIAILQNILSSYGHASSITASPEVAGITGIVLKSIQQSYHA